MIVAALYNIVDQIFIGWSEAGAYGNAATNIVYPFTVLALGLALLIGDGAAAGFSIIKALYANMFEVEDRNAKPPKTYVYQYVDVITKEIEILEIANSIPRNEERPSRARHGNQSI